MGAVTRASQFDITGFLRSSAIIFNVNKRIDNKPIPPISRNENYDVWKDSSEHELHKYWGRISGYDDGCEGLGYSPGIN